MTVEPCDVIRLTSKITAGTTYLEQTDGIEMGLRRLTTGNFALDCNPDGRKTLIVKQSSDIRDGETF